MSGKSRSDHTRPIEQARYPATGRRAFLLRKEDKQMTAAQQLLNIRPTRRDDLAEVLGVLNAFSLQQYGEVEFTEKGTLAEWDSGDIDVERDTRVAVNSEGRIVAFIEYWSGLLGNPTSPECFLYGIPGLVDSADAGRMIRFALERAEAALYEVPSDVIWLGTYVVADDAAKRAAFESAGFREERYSFKMFRELNSALEQPAIPEGIEVRPFVSGVDERAVFDARKEVWQDMRGGVPLSFEQWRYYMIDTNDQFEADCWWVAWSGREVAGFCLCSPSTVEDPQMAWVTSLGVRRAYRNRGLATALLLNAFGEFYRRGIKKVGLDVDSESPTGANRIYERAGMRPVRTTVRYVKRVNSEQ
jgi:ribosomal protein S18 acetylase RimI-like enzyme